MNDRHNYGLYVVLALFVGIPSLAYKILDDVADYEELSEVCSDQVVTARLEAGGDSFWNRWRYEKLRITLLDGQVAVMHGITPGYTAAAQVIQSRQDYCIWFDLKGNSKSVYQVSVGDRLVMGYDNSSTNRRANVNGFFLIGMAALFVGFPFFLYKYWSENRGAH